ncbi:MAG: hypothetical protein A4E62_02253 [Syntrophorhabdus sp. PtaU1.Bin002]|nr:MAG: hypothetical protein A4E62_02253 [Syntrophorhabdus sp. PtaU1.Bin002]
MNTDCLPNKQYGLFLAGLVGDPGSGNNKLSSSDRKDRTQTFTLRKGPGLLAKLLLDLLAQRSVTRQNIPG